MRPGYKTTEFWITLVGQIIAMAVTLGIVRPGDQQHLQMTANEAITAICTLLVSAVTIRHYIISRTQLKQQVPQPGSPPPAEETGPGPGAPGFTPIAVLLALLFLPAVAGAQERHTCFGWRQQRTDPALLQVLQQIAAQQQQIIVLMQQQHHQPPAPQYIVLGGPWQQIPLGGQPYQQIPLGGPPRQDIPLGGPPRQEIPLGPPPRQDIPLGPQPRQQIPLGEPKPPPAMPPAGTVGYQRYTWQAKR